MMHACAMFALQNQIVNLNGRKRGKRKRPDYDDTEELEVWADKDVKYTRYEFRNNNSCNTINNKKY